MDAQNWLLKSFQRAPTSAQFAVSPISENILPVYGIAVNAALSRIEALRPRNRFAVTRKRTSTSSTRSLPTSIGVRSLTRVPGRATPEVINGGVKLAFLKEMPGRVLSCVATLMKLDQEGVRHTSTSVRR